MFFRNTTFWLTSVICVYFALGLVSILTAPESIDEYSIDYWSTRLAHNFLDPVKALQLEPSIDKQMGFIGFIRSGHFVYNKTLDQITAGIPYSIVPMVPVVPLYVHALPKRVFGDRVFHLVHLALLVTAFLIPWWLYRRQVAHRTEWLILGLLVFLTPAVFVNATYAMTDSVGLLGISLFSSTLFIDWPRRCAGLWAILMILGVISMVFYKPIGWVLLPWSMLLILLRPRTPRIIKAGVVLAVALCVVGICALSEKIYSSVFWAGYHNPINQFLKWEITLSNEQCRRAGIPEPIALKVSTIPFVSEDQFLKVVPTVLSSEEQKQYELTIKQLCKQRLTKEAQTKGVMKNRFTILTNMLYGLPALLLCYPLMFFLLAAIARDLWQEWCQRTDRRWTGLLTSRLFFKLVYLAAFGFLLLFYMFYNHSPSLGAYLSLTNPTFRYFLIPFICLVWYIRAWRVPLQLTKRVFPLAALSLALLLVLPNNLPQRVIFRIYLRVLQDELQHVLPENTILLGAYKYDRYFDLERVPSYSFIAHQRYPAYQKCFEEYRSVLGDLPAIVRAVYLRNKVPIIIYPDTPLPDARIAANPYMDLNLVPLATIDMASKFGPFGHFLPEDKRMIHVNRLCPSSELDPAD